MKTRDHFVLGKIAEGALDIGNGSGDGGRQERLVADLGQSIAQEEHFFLGGAHEVDAERAVNVDIDEPGDQERLWRGADPLEGGGVPIDLVGSESLGAKHVVDVVHSFRANPPLDWVT